MLADVVDNVGRARIEAELRLHILREGDDGPIHAELRGVSEDHVIALVGEDGVRNGLRHRGRGDGVIQFTSIPDLIRPIRVVELVEHVEVVRAIPKDAYGVDVDRVGAVSDDAIIDGFRPLDGLSIGAIRFTVGDKVQPVGEAVFFLRVEPTLGLQQRIFIVRVPARLIIISHMSTKERL